MAVAGIYIIYCIDYYINSLPTNKNIPEIVEYIFIIPYSFLLSIYKESKPQRDLKPLFIQRADKYNLNKIFI